MNHTSIKFSDLSSVNRLDARFWCLRAECDKQLPYVMKGLRACDRDTLLRHVAAIGLCQPVWYAVRHGMNRFPRNESEWDSYKNEEVAVYVCASLDETLRKATEQLHNAEKELRCVQSVRDSLLHSSPPPSTETPQVSTGAVSSTLQAGAATAGPARLTE